MFLQSIYKMQINFISSIYRLFELDFEDLNIKLVSKDFSPLQSIGPQKCVAFSTDGSKFAVGGEVY